MKATPLQMQWSQIAAQMHSQTEALKQQVDVHIEEIDVQREMIQKLKMYINELEKSQKLQHDYQALMRRENLLLSKKLKDMKTKSIEKDKIIKLYQEEISKEISWKELTVSLEELRIKLEAHLKQLLTVSYLRPLIQQEIEGVLRPYLNALTELESIDWSTLQDNELSLENALITLNDLNKT